MNILEAVKICFQKYFTITGRARRAEFWWFMLFIITTSIALVFIDPTGILYSIFSLIILFPSLTVAIRRLQDIGYNGWWVLLNFIPFFGIAWILYYGSKGSDPESNKYGAPPY